MMSDRPTPDLWQEIAVDPAQSGFVMRRVLPQLVHNLFVGESRPARRRFLDLELLEDASDLSKPRVSKGLDIKVDSTKPGTVRIRLMSTMPVGDAVFTDLASDVVGVLAIAPGPGAAARVLDRVAAWQEFLARKSEPLSKDAAAGLFAELVVLRHGFIPAVGKLATVSAWTGPDPALQDFQYGSCAVEVKSFRGIGSGRMRISSERQLEDVGTEVLFLAYVELDERRDGTGLTLKDIVDGIRGELIDAVEAFHLFEGKLLSGGWHDSVADFRDERYEVRSLEYFEVVPGFPRITSSDLPEGVGGVTYVLDRSPLEPFLRDESVVFDRIKEST